MTAVDLDLTLHPASPAYRAELRCILPGTDAPIDVAALVQIDPLRLRELASDPAAYGLALGQMVFVGDIATTFAQAHAVAQQRSIPLRLRLAFADDDDPLHFLRWEVLRSPPYLDAPPLTTGTQMLFSRALSGADGQPVVLRPKGALRALVILASPSDLPRYLLRPFDLEAEHAMIEASFAPIPTTVLGRGQASLDLLMQHLREGYDIVYLLTHECFDPVGDIWLYPEGADGLTAPVPVSTVVARLAELRVRPCFIIFGGCETGGNLLSLGPLLAQAGVPAVLVMRGQITRETLHRFLSECLRVFQQGGPVDQAVAVARDAVRERPDFWKLVLFLHPQSGRL